MNMDAGDAAAAVFQALPPGLTAWLSAHAALAALVLARTAGLAWTAPALSAPGLGVRLRFLLAVGLAAVVAPAVAAEGATLGGPTAWPRLAAAGLAEGLVGAALGWTAALVIAGARQAGELVGGQAGFAPAALVDPEIHDDLNAMGHLYGLVALGLFLALDGPLALVRGLAASYHAVPPGAGALSGFVVPGGAVTFAFGRVTEALTLALRAAAPAALALTLAGVALALVSRAAPSLQRAALAVPARAAVGVVVAFGGLAALAAALQAAWAAWPGPGLSGP